MKRTSAKHMHGIQHRRKSGLLWLGLVLIGVLAVGLAVILWEEDDSASQESVLEGVSELTSVGKGTQTYSGSYRSGASTCSVTVTLTTGDYDPARDSVKTTATRTENCVPDPPPPTGK